MNPLIQDLSYALAKQVPDMQERGFSIGTAYGDVNVPAGPLANRIAKFVQEAFECELLKLRAKG